MVSQEFSEAVENGKIVRVRIMLKDSMLVDPTTRQFDALFNYASEKLGNLYDEHDGETLKYEVSLWNESYLNGQMVKVVNNFSKERIELLKNMVKYLYRERAEKIASEENNAYGSDKNISRKQIGMGVSAAGAVVTVAGIAASESFLVIGGVVAVAAGAVMILTDKGN